MSVSKLPVLYNWDPGTQFNNFRPAKMAVMGGKASTRCKIICMGDSTTAGVGGTNPATEGYRGVGDYPHFMMLALNKLGVPASDDTMCCTGNDTNGSDPRIVLSGSGAGFYGTAGLGGQPVGLTAAGATVTYTATAANQYDHVDVYAIGTGTNCSVSINGGAATTLTFPNISSGNQMTFQTLSFTARTGVVVAMSYVNGNFWLQGPNLYNSASPMVEVWNGGSGGADTGGYNVATGYGGLQGVLAATPHLCLYNVGINDNNNNTPTPATYQTNLQTTVTALKAANSDIILIFPQPFNSAYPATLPQYRAAMYAVAQANNVPLIDLGNRMGNSTSTYASMMYGNLHPTQYIYRDIGNFLANLLATV